jgi:hypothetical protein
MVAILPIFDDPHEAGKVKRAQKSGKVIEKVNANGDKEGSVGDDTPGHDSDWGKESLVDDKHGDKHHAYHNHGNDARCDPVSVRHI